MEFGQYYNSKGKLIQEFDFNENLFVTNSECETRRTNMMHRNKWSYKGFEINLSSYKNRWTSNFYKKLISVQISKKSPFEINSSGRTTINVDETLSFFVSKEPNLENIEYSGKEDNEDLEKGNNDLFVR